MDRPLLLVWQDEFSQQVPIIDEQHRAILATINSLHYFLQQGLEFESLLPTVKLLISYIVFHYKTEEGILNSTEYPELKNYQQQMDNLITEFKVVCEHAKHQKRPEQVLIFLKDWWQAHLEEHKTITPYLHDWSGEYCRVDKQGEREK
ncbi:MAG TPA: chemotaxis protein [Methylophaga aminisulfidivorans]|jgi:hemerythrin|uniref:bacteriohemerythrin n=1 Tax=Methylophaga TaxID=40222 RepID=UPI00176D459E|nr:MULTISPECIES: hemerythrin domain-containing protein [Methylophaga]HIC47325.1 chemotaxis protein [Methylophaga sp.]HIM38394.1 chemotaxis protein [Methylophaga aminisulfidivorans]